MAQTPRAFHFASGTLISKFTGLVREIVVARVLGASVLLDAFFVAFRIPNLFRDMLAEGALGSSFTKYYSALRATSPEQAKDLAVQMFTFTFCLTSTLTAAGILFRKHLVYLMTSHTPQSYTTFLQTTENLTAILLPFMILSSCAAIVSGVLYEQKRFFFSSISPLWVNVVALIGILFFGPYLKETNLLSALGDPALIALALGTLMGGVIQLIWLLAPVIRIFWPLASLSQLKRSFLSHDSAFLQTCRQSLPMMLTASVAQINLIISTNFATSLAPGSTSWLNLAFRIIQLPVGLFAVGIATVILPALAVHFSRISQSAKGSLSAEGSLSAKGSQNTAAQSELTIAIQATLWLMIPCTVVTMLMADEIIFLLFYGGSFALKDVLMTSYALQAYAVGILGYGLIKVLLSYFYASHQTRFVAQMTILSLILSAVLNALFIGSWGHVALAAVGGGMLTLQALCLMLKAGKKSAFSGKTILKSFLYTLIASLLTVLSFQLLRKPLALLSSLQETAKISTSSFDLTLLALKNLAAVSLLAALIFFLCMSYHFRLSPKRLLKNAKKIIKR